MKGKIPVSRAKTAYGLLQDIKRVAMEEPLRIDMGFVLAQGEELAIMNKKVPACGTVGCVAGWALALTGHENMGSDTAGEILGLDITQREQLFFPDSADLYSNPQTKAHARRVCRHIDRFVKANESQLRAKKIR